MGAIIETNNLTKIFGKHKAVDHVNLSIHQGDIYGLIGRNGAGKTTLMKMIGNLSQASSGSYTIYGKKAEELGDLASRVSCMIENTGIYPSFTAYDHILLKGQALGLRKKDYIEEVLEIVNLSSAGKKKVKNFSLGMKQRLGLALALVGNPDILILDEPTNGLDPQGIVEIRKTINRLNREKNITFIISSHILGELAKLATRFAIINDGSLIANFTREEMEEQNRDRLELVTDDKEKTSILLDQIIGIENYQIMPDDNFYIYLGPSYIKEIIQVLTSNGIAIEYFSVHEASLEDYYLKLLAER